MKHTITNVYEKQVKDAIYCWGRDVLVIHNATSNCSSCGYDPINKEATNMSCDTCNGTFFFYTESALPIKGVLKTFIGNMGFADNMLQKYGYTPDSDARITCFLDDILIAYDSATGPTYLDNPNRVIVDGKNYDVKSTQRTGIDELVFMVATLKEKK